MRPVVSHPLMIHDRICLGSFHSRILGRSVPRLGFSILKFKKKEKKLNKNRGCSTWTKNKKAWRGMTSKPNLEVSYKMSKARQNL